MQRKQTNITSYEYPWYLAFMTQYCFQRMWSRWNVDMASLNSECHPAAMVGVLQYHLYKVKSLQLVWRLGTGRLLNEWLTPAPDTGGVSIYRPCLTSIGIHIMKIRRSDDHLIFTTGIPIPRKDDHYTEKGPRIAERAWGVHSTRRWTWQYYMVL